MALAPSLKDVEQLSKTKQPQGAPMAKNEEVSKAISNFEELDLAINGIVEYSIIGCGGAGKVAAIRFAKTQTKVSKPPVITTIDTSGVSSKIEGVESLCIEGLQGSGKLRRENADAIKSFATDYVERNEFAPVNILVFSAAGGSGSVIGPVLLAEILRQGKIAIVITLVDIDSATDSVNSFNLLKTLDNISKSKGAYVPTVLFDNSNGRFKVDSGIDSTLANLAELLSQPLIGLDTQDRLRFLNPIEFDGVTAGIKLLNLSRTKDGGWEDNGQFDLPDTNDRIDAALIISQLADHLTLDKRCVVTFRGYRDDDQSNLIASVGYPLPESVIKMLNATIHAHKSSTPTKETKVQAEYEIGKDSGGGLIL